MMRCITAICPAGPPNDIAAIRSQTRSASPNETPCAGTERRPAGAGTSVMRIAPLRLRRRRPVVRLGLQAAAPGVERVIHDHAVFEHGMIVRVIGGKAERQRQ